MSFRCPSCGAELQVYEDTRRLTCSGCATAMMVGRRHGTIALAPLGQGAHTIENEEKPAAELSLDRLTGGLQQLEHESSGIRRRQITVALVGCICGSLFGVAGVWALLGSDIPVGFAMLVCGGGSLWFVRFVMNDSTTAADKIARQTKELEGQIADGRQKTSASTQGIDRIAVDLYLKEIVYYPSWIQHSRGHVPASISAAVKAGADAVKLTVKGSEYLFNWEQGRFDQESRHGQLTLSVNDSVVLSVSAVVSEDQWIISTSSHCVLAFVEGFWVETLLAVWAEAKECLHARK